jgi:Tol biopolymer transport system component
MSIMLVLSLGFAMTSTAVSAAADDPETVALTTGSAEEFAPSWSPDGMSLAFTKISHGNADVYVSAADGTGIVRLTTRSGFDGQADWR